MTSDSVGLLVIATGRYLDFARDLFGDLARVVGDSDAVTVNLFTDADPSAVSDASRAAGRIAVNHVPIGELRWPEASLLRYELFSEHADSIVGARLVYLDADLRVERDFGPLIQPQDWPGGLAAVRHPGYYRPRQVRPRGTWETRPESRAYVPRRRRRRYVCGGVWMGGRSEVLGMSASLATRVREDKQAGITARWHDESHWNWWTATHRVHMFDPSLCWVPDYPWLAGLEPYIVAVDKGTHFEREATAPHLHRGTTRQGHE